MQAEVEARFQSIEALLRATAQNGAEMERRFNRRMDTAEQRAKRADERAKRADERADRADERMDKFDQRLEATRKLVETGMKLMIRMNARIDEIGKSQKLILKLLQGGGKDRKSV